MLLMQRDTVILIKHVLAPHQSIAFYRSKQLWLKLTHKAARMLFRGIPLGHAADIFLWLHWVENYTASVWEELSVHVRRLVIIQEVDSHSVLNVFIFKRDLENMSLSIISFGLLLWITKHQTFLLNLTHTHLTSRSFLIPFFYLFF